MAFHSIFSVVNVNMKYSYRLACAASSFFLGYGRFAFGRSVHSLPVTNGIVRQPLIIPSMVFTRSASDKKKRVDPPTDFLPFPWQRSKPFNQIEKSGDHVRSLDVDLNLPKEGLDLSEYMKELDTNVRKLFTLESGTKEDRRRISREIILKKVQQHPVDFNSKEVKIALQTLRVRSLMEHFNFCLRMPKYKRSPAKVLLIHAIHRRNKMLRLLRLVDLPRFEWLIKELNIDYTPAPLAMVKLRYTRKNELRRLTKEYCEKLIGEKRAAYHAELKEQQQAFLKEKEEILAWIAEEERDLGISQSNNSGF